MQRGNTASWHTWYRGASRCELEIGCSGGQRVGLCGHSGHSTEPHLHFQVQDRGNFFLAASLPLAFTNTVVNGEKQTGPVYLSIGDLVSALEPAPDRARRPR